MKREQCGNCGNMAQVKRGNYRLDEMGLPLVLQRVELIKCDKCGTVEPIIPNMDGLMHSLALAVICRPCKLNGAEVRFLRTYLGKSGVDFSALLHLDKTTLSKIEHGHQEAGPQTDRLIRLLAVNLSPDLKYVVDRLVKMMPKIEDCNPPHRGMIEIDPDTQQYQYA